MLQLIGVLWLGIQTTATASTFISWKPEPFELAHAKRAIQELTKSQNNSLLFARRRQVKDSTLYPYTIVGTLITTSSGRPRICTATLVHSRAILTAAQCFFENKETTPSGGYFFPGMNIGTENMPYGAFWTSKIHILSDYQEALLTRNEEAAFRNNIAIAELNKSSQFTGFLRIRKKNTYFRFTPISVIAYHNDKISGSMWFENCRLLKVTVHHLTHNCKLGGNWSVGSSVIRYINGEPTASAINISTSYFGRSIAVFLPESFHNKIEEIKASTTLDN